jgi:hypothetical protein
MRKIIISVILSICLLLSGCGIDTSLIKQTNTENIENNDTEEADDLTDTLGNDNDDSNDDISFSGLDDAKLLMYVENTLYSDLIDELDDNYFVENVDAVYLSQEYMDDLAYNSQDNVFFGYSLDDLEAQFQGERYAFTLGDDGQTTVIELQEVYGDTYDQIMQNVAIGSGVILVCVTVSAVTGGIAPAVSMIFAASAKTGTVFALESGVLSFAAASIARGYQTQDFEQAIKAGALAASESFKWGAIIGGVSGGINEGLALKGATLNGLTMNEVAKIQRESKWPLEAIKSIHSTAEYEVYKNAELIPTQITDGTWAFLREIDWNLVDEFGQTNIERVQNNLAPIDATGKPYELHHVGQKADSPLAILTYSEHHSKKNYKILHYQEEGKDVADAVWKAQKKDFWNAVLEMAQGG